MIEILSLITGAWMAVAGFFGGAAIGAPTVSYEKDLLPIADSTYSVGTTSRAFADGVFDRICLTGDTCETSWPTGGGGGTGNVSTSTNETAGDLAYWTTNSGSPARLGAVSTTSVTCTGSTTCSSFTAIGSSPITINSTGVGSGLATTSPIADSNVLTYSAAGTGSAYGTATTSLTLGTNLSYSGTLGALIGGIAGSLTIDDVFLINNGDDSTSGNLTANSFIGPLTGNADTATALASNGANCSAGNFPLGVDASGAVETCTDAWTEAENTAAAYISLTDLSATWPINYNNGTGAFTWGGLATTSQPTAGQLLYSDGVNGLIPVSTSSINVGTATALEANGSNCPAGSYSLGVDASGASEGCTDATTEIDSAITTHTGNSTAHQALVTLAGALDYLTLSGQEITRNAIDLATDITGTLGITNGGTGTSTPAVGGQILAWVGSNWQGVATTTFSSGLTYSNGNVTSDLGTSIDLASAEVTGTLAVGNGGTGVTALTSLNLTDFTNDLSALTAGTGLSSGGTYNGSTARTFSLDTANANTWTALQTFSNASSTNLDVWNQAAFGATATSSFDSAGVLTLIGNLIFDGTTLTGTTGVDTQLVSGTLSTTNAVVTVNADDDLVEEGTLTWNVTPATCTGDGNGGALTVNGSNQIVCSADDGGAGGSGDPFAWTPATHWGQTVSGTTTALWLQGSPFSLFASSTAQFDNASTTQFSVGRAQSGEGSLYIYGNSTSHVEALNGNLSLHTDDGANTSSNVHIFSGNVTTSGNAGYVDIYGGNGAGASGNGGDVYIYGGSGAGSGADGNVIIGNPGYGIIQSTGSQNLTLNADALSAARTVSFPNLSGSPAYGSFTTGFLNGNIPFGASGLLATSTGFSFNDTDNRLTITYASTTAISGSNATFTTLVGALTGNVTGNADTASALAANGGNCTSGNAPLGVDALGAVEDCFDVWTEAENTAASYIALTDLSATWPINYNNGTGAFTWGGIATSSGLTTSQVLYATGVNTFESVATTSVSGGDAISFTGTAGALLGGTNLTINFDGGSAPGGELGGTWASPTIDDALAVTNWNLTTPTFTTNFTFDGVAVTGISGVDTTLLSGTVATTNAVLTVNVDDDIVEEVNGLTWNITPATCTGDGNGGALTVSGTEIVCSADDGGGGGVDAFEIATTSGIAVSELAYYTQASGRTTIGGVATTTITAGTGLSYSGTLGALVGGVNGTLSVDASQTQITAVGALGTGSITSGFGNIDVGASTIDTTGAVSFGNTTVNTGATLTVTDLTSAILLTGAGGTLAEYTGTSCTNQFVRSLSALGVATCETVQNTDLANSTVSYGGIQLSLGGSDATPAFNLADATAYPGDSSLVTTGALNSGSITSGFGNIDIGSSNFDADGIITSLGTLDFGGATSLEIPNNGTVNANGEITTDDTSGQLRFFAGSAERVISPVQRLGFAYATTSWTGTTTLNIGPAYLASSVDYLYCETNTGTVAVSLYDGTNRADFVPTASTTINKFNYSTNNTFTAGESMRVDLGQPASSPTRISCSFGYTVTAD